MVFFDRSSSAQQDSVAEVAFREAVTELAEDALQCEGDRLDGYVLFSNTGTAYHERFEVITPPLELKDVAELDRPREELQWEEEMAQERLDAVDLLQMRLVQLEGIPREALQETDILGSLRVIAERFEEAPDSAYQRVLYLSDMHESKRGAGRRDFDVRPPADLAEARVWAEADVARLIEQEEVAPGALRGVSVRALRSTLGIGSEADAVRAYWQIVFKELKADDVQLE